MASEIENLNPTLENELHLLNQRLEMVRAQYNEWTDCAAMIQEKENLSREIASDGIQKCDTIRQEIKECRALLSDNKKKLSQETVLENKLRRELEETALKADAALREKEQMAVEVEQRVEENQHQRELVADKERSTSEIRHGLEKAAKMSRESLGLQFKKLSGGRLQVVFTQIDPKEPNFPFVFTIKIKDNTTYTVSDVQPSVAELTELVTSLNASNEFAKFVRKMRQAFKDALQN